MAVGAVFRRGLENGSAAPQGLGGRGARRTMAASICWCVR